jgi:serine racemase
MSVLVHRVARIISSRAGVVDPGTNNAADVAESLAAGERVWREKVNTIADGLQGRLGRLTWPLIRDHVDGCIVVSEEEIVEAMKLMFERMKVLTGRNL